MSGRIVPVPTAESQPWWDGLRRHELLLQRCASCAALQLYPRLLCTRCGHRELGWVRASGRGTLASFATVRRPVSAAYAAEAPYLLVLVALEEGPTLMSTLVDCEPGAARIGLPVEVVFDDWPEGVTLPRFRPRR